MKHLVILMIAMSLAACASRKQATDDSASLTPCGPSFSADSAYAFCEAQCAFGPRVMNSAAHDQCEQWIVSKFQSYGLSITTQKTTLKGYDGTPLRATNIVASYRPELSERILLCAHWDSRPWADNDPDASNHRTPVLAANDGASGVAVMLEIARQLNSRQVPVDSLRPAADSLQLNLGVDFVCFDAEDWGVPQWLDRSDESSWALGAQYWASHYDAKGKEMEFGILLDMVGGEAAQFHQERMSMRYAPQVVERVWRAAHAAGYSGYFPMTLGGGITDDHLPVNEKAGIPTIDIIPYYPECEQSSFGPTWHTVDDTMSHIDKNTLKAVGQTLIQVIFTL